MAAEAPPLLSGTGVGVSVAGVAIGAVALALESSIHLRRTPVIDCWSSRAAGDVKVKVWFSVLSGCWTTILMDAFADVAGVCWRSSQQFVNFAIHCLGSDILVMAAMSTSTARSPPFDFHDTVRPSVETRILPSFFLYCATASDMVEKSERLPQYSDATKRLLKTKIYC